MGGLSVEEHNKRWVEECGREFTCPSCGAIWKEEIWRENDGPCRDGKFHCQSCLIEGKCGCFTKEDEEPA